MPTGRLAGFKGQHGQAQWEKSMSEKQIMNKTQIYYMRQHL